MESKVKKHPLLHGFSGSEAKGSNQGRVEVPVRGPGELCEGSGAEKGKAQIAHAFPVGLACEQDEHEGGYRAGPAGK